MKKIYLIIGIIIIALSLFAINHKPRKNIVVITHSQKYYHQNKFTLSKTEASEILGINESKIEAINNGSLDSKAVKEVYVNIGNNRTIVYIINSNKHIVYEARSI